MLKADEQEYVNMDDYRREAKQKTKQPREEQKKRQCRNKEYKRHKGHMKGIRQQARGDRVKRKSIHPVEKLLCFRWLC